MSRFLVLTGTTGVPILERGICQLEGSDHLFLLQTKNKIEKCSNTNVSHVHFLDMTSLMVSEFDAVIGHCGAGTVFWALENRLPLLVVVDLERPDNHQSDLGDWLSRNNFAIVVQNRVPTIEDLESLLNHQFSEYIADPFRYEKIDELLS